MVFPVKRPGPQFPERVIPDIDEDNLIGHGPGAPELAPPVIGLELVKVENSEIGKEGNENPQAQDGQNAVVSWLLPKLLPLLLHSPLLPLVQRRLFFGAPLPPLDPAFSFREPGPPGRSSGA